MSFEVGVGSGIWGFLVRWVWCGGIGPSRIGRRRSDSDEDTKLPEAGQIKLEGTIGWGVEREKNL